MLFHSKNSIVLKENHDFYDLLNECGLATTNFTRFSKKQLKKDYIFFNKKEAFNVIYGSAFIIEKYDYNFTEKHLTFEQRLNKFKELTKQFKNIDFSSATYRYAPEIRKIVVNLYDKAIYKEKTVSKQERIYNTSLMPFLA